MPVDAPWYKHAVIYQVHVRAFLDSTSDGVGDFAGLTSKLGYLEELGVDTLWLLPFYPSPLKDDGYDIADYENIHPSYGTLADFDRFIAEAHRRHLRTPGLVRAVHTPRRSHRSALGVAGRRDGSRSQRTSVRWQATAGGARPRRVA